MIWPHDFVAALQRGETVTCQPRGNSMTPRVVSGQKCTLTPIALADVKVDDVVLCKVKGTVYLHLVTAVRKGQVQISNNHGRVNGWTAVVYGKLQE